MATGRPLNRTVSESSKTCIGACEGVCQFPSRSSPKTRYVISEVDTAHKSEKTMDIAKPIVSIDSIV